MARVLNNEYGTNLSQESKYWERLDKYFDKKNKDDPDKKDRPFIVAKEEKKEYIRIER